MAQWLRTLVENPDLVSSTQMLAHNHPDSGSKRLDTPFSPPGATGVHVMHMHTHKQNTYIHEITNL